MIEGYDDDDGDDLFTFLLHLGHSGDFGNERHLVT